MVLKQHTTKVLTCMYPNKGVGKGMATPYQYIRRIDLLYFCPRICMSSLITLDACFFFHMRMGTEPLTYTCAFVCIIYIYIFLHRILCICIWMYSILFEHVLVAHRNTHAYTMLHICKYKCKHMSSKCPFTHLSIKIILIYLCMFLQAWTPNMCMVFSRNDGLSYVLKGIESKQSSMAPKLALPEW